MRSAPRSHDSRPDRQVSAVWAANSSGDMLLRFASAGSTQDRKSSARKAGKLSSKFPMSPLGSMTRAGIPERRASSRATTPRPVLPEPVMPTMTP